MRPPAGPRGTTSMAAGSPGLKLMASTRVLSSRASPTLASLAATMKAMAATTRHLVPPQIGQQALQGQPVGAGSLRGRRDDGECGGRIHRVGAMGDNPDCCYLVIVLMFASFSPATRRYCLSEQRTGAQSHSHARATATPTAIFLAVAVMAQALGRFGAARAPCRNTYGRPLWRSKRIHFQASRCWCESHVLPHINDGQHLASPCRLGLPSVDSDQGSCVRRRRGHADLWGHRRHRAPAPAARCRRLPRATSWRFSEPQDGGICRTTAGAVMGARASANTGRSRPPGARLTSTTTP